MTPRKRKEYSDFETYRRLLKYLRGTGPVIALLLVCMVLEALCTVGTISLIKPMVDLMIVGRLVDTGPIHKSDSPFEFGIVHAPGDGISGVAAAGQLTGRKAGQELQDKVETLVQDHHKTALIDLSRVSAIDDYGVAAIEFARQRSAGKGVQTVFVLPDSVSTSASLPAATSTFQVVQTAGIPAEFAALLKAVPPPAPPKKAELGTVDRIKKSVADRVAPVIQAIERYAEGNLFKVLAGLVGLMLVFAVGVTVFGFFVGYLSSWLGSVCVLNLRNHVWQHMMGLDMSYFTKQSVGANMSVVTQDVGSVTNAIDVLFSGVIKTPITIAIIVAAMYVYSPKLTVFCLTVVPVMAVVVFAIGRSVRRISVNVQHRRAEMSGLMNEIFSGMRVVKGYSMEEAEIAKFQDKSQEIFKLGIRTKIFEEIGTGLTGLFGFITIGAVILAGGYTVLRSGEMSGSDFALFIGLLSQVFRPLKTVNKTNSRIQRGLAGCDRVFAVLESRPRIVEKPNAVELKPLQRDIVFENLWFAYSRETGYILKDINLTVPRGKVIALVGETGAGKSTLVNLLPRFYEPTKGRVLWDGTDIRDATLKSLRAQMALITQEIILFDDTVANNIAYGFRDEVPRERIIEAARAANALQFVERLPQGFETMIGSRGARLSGGEKQRLAIARAILRDAPVLILDEATSALDSETEALIQDALVHVIKGRTVFVIAHRLSTVHNADEILVMENGGISERGTHEQLMAIGGRYARYYNIQFKQKQTVEAE